MTTIERPANQRCHSPYVSVVTAMVALCTVMWPMMNLGCANDGPEDQAWAPSPPQCQLASSDPRAETVETRCDGLDNDCDLLTDMLMPVDRNRCSTGAQGVCGAGYYVCLGGARICLAQAPAAETYDGLDNDCDGQVDNVPTVATVACRARVLVPPYLWTESTEPVKEVIRALETAGIPYDVDTTAADWDKGFGELSKYSLLIIPGYQLGYIYTPAHLTALKKFINDGGVLLWHKLLGSTDEKELTALAGVTAVSKRADVTLLHFGAAEATLYLDSLEERNLKISDDPVTKPDEVYLYTADPAKGSVSFAKAFAGGLYMGTPMIRRKLGKGAVYTLGHALMAFLPARCYVNCFDPGADVAAMLFKGALREACRGHYAMKHTAPSTKGSVLLLTHDTCAPDAQNGGPWGRIGSIQMAEMEASLGVKASYFFTTDYVAGYFNPGTVIGLCNLGMCPEGSHSVQHKYMNKLPRGDCAVTRATYDVTRPTVCGEILVSMQILRGLITPGSSLTAWRAPYLEVHPEMYDVLSQQGVRFDSSLGLGDLRTNLPLDLTLYPYPNNAWFHPAKVITFPVNLEDGFGAMDAAGHESRVELQMANQPKFLALWTYTMLQNHKNGAWTTLLVHPSYGHGVGPANLPIKIDSVRRLIQVAKQHDLHVDQITPLGNFWLGRQAATLTVSYSNSAGYAGEIQVGAHAAPRFSLEFGDQIKSFQCSGASNITIAGNRVVIEDTLAPMQKYTFTASVK